MNKKFTRKQEIRLTNAYFYMKKYEDYLKKMYKENKLFHNEYYMLISDIKRTYSNLSSVIGVHTDICEEQKGVYYE